MFIRNRSSQAGDTLIEVLLATSILAFVVVGTSFIMNTSLSRVQLSLERTQVQAAIAGQGAILRALRDAAVKDGQTGDAVKEWNKVIGFVSTSSATAQQAVCTPPGTTVTRFVFYNQGSSISGWLRPVQLGQITTPQDALPSNATSLPEPGDGLWIEAYKGGSVAFPYYDFYIKACWQAAGDHPKQELKTVVRLYGNL